MCPDKQVDMYFNLIWAIWFFDLLHCSHFELWSSSWIWGKFQVGSPQLILKSLGLLQDHNSVEKTLTGWNGMFSGICPNYWLGSRVNHSIDMWTRPNTDVGSKKLVPNVLSRCNAECYEFEISKQTPFFNFLFIHYRLYNTLQTSLILYRSFLHHLFTIIIFTDCTSIVWYNDLTLRTLRHCKNIFDFLKNSEISKAIQEILNQY